MAAAPLRRLLLLACPLLLLAGCATGPQSIEISRSQLEDALARRFPYEARPGGVFAVNVGLPALQLRPEENRLRLDFPVAASDRVLRSGAEGTLAVSFGLRYAPADASIRATGVRVEQLDVQGVPEPWRSALRLAGATVAERVLEDAVLHALPPEQLARARGWTPRGIRVTATGVQVELQPPP